MDNEPSWCSAIDVVSETGAEAEAISSLFNIELLVLISDSEGATTTVAEERMMRWKQPMIHPLFI